MDDRPEEESGEPKQPRWRSAALAGLVHASSPIAAWRSFSSSAPRLLQMTRRSKHSSRILLRANASSLQNPMPLSVIAFLWFIAVIRRGSGIGEDKFFSSEAYRGVALCWRRYSWWAWCRGSHSGDVDTDGQVPDPDSYRLMRSSDR